MRFPWLQVGSDVVAAKAQDLSVLLGCSRREAIGLLVDLWAWVLTRSPDNAPPDGIIRDSRTGTGAVPVLERAVSWGGPEGMLVTALEEVGFVERLPDGLRFRGVERYASTWEKNKRRKNTGTKPEGNRSGTGAVPAPKTYTQTQKETTTFPADAGRVEAEGEEADDAGPEPSAPAAAPVQSGLGLLTPVAAPKPPRAKRKPSPGVALYEAMEAAREGRWKAHVLAHPETYPEAVADPEDGWRRTFIAQQWAPARAEKELGPLAKRDDAGRKRLEAAFEEYLADDVGLSREPPWSLPWFLRCLPSYETRAMRAATGSAA